MKEFLKLSDLTVNNQLSYNLLWRVIEQEIQPFCLEKDIGVAVYSHLLCGLLTGKFETLIPFRMAGPGQDISLTKDRKLGTVKKELKAKLLTR